MLSIHLEAQDFVDEDEMNYETDEIKKENLNESWIFIAEQKSEKYIIYNKIRQANLMQVLSKEERVERSKRRTFSSEIFVKKKNGVTYKPATLYSTYFQRSIQRHLNPKGSLVNLQKEDGFKLPWEVLKFWWKHYWSNTVKVISTSHPRSEKCWSGQLFRRMIVWWPKTSSIAACYQVAL